MTAIESTLRLFVRGLKPAGGTASRASSVDPRQTGANAILRCVMLPAFVGVIAKPGPGTIIFIGAAYEATSF